MVRYDRDNIYISSFDIENHPKVRRKALDSVDESRSTCEWAGHVYVEMGREDVKSEGYPRQFNSEGRDVTVDSATYIIYECARCHDRVRKEF